MTVQDRVGRREASRRASRARNRAKNGLCPPDHSHGDAGTCWSGHGCRCTPCSVRERKRVNEAYWYRKNTLGLNRYVDAIGARRRLQALAVLGWGTKALAAHTGVTHAHLQQVRSGAYKTVMQDTHHAIDRAYRALMWTRNTTKGAAGTSAHARRMQWIPPAGWDDIDNKKERPKGLSDE